MITIRPARAEEFDEVARVWIRSRDGTGVAPADAPSCGQLCARLERETAGPWEVYVAEDGGRILAMMALQPADHYLAQLWVDPPDQGRGVGHALMTFAKQRMAPEVWLRTPAEDAAANAWYLRQGFVPERCEPHPVVSLMMQHYRWRA